MSPAKRRGLGRGLDALLTSNKETDDATQRNLSSNQDSELQYLPIEQLQQGKYQPRKDMSAEALEDLSNSILSQGIIQPIVVRNISENNYEIIAGERRWR
ncbi:ParB/RepB/Spo0J family partition protein, partial [Colwellia sp. BRX8-8]|nr:ParB/RepB/Spo0J family partition protein [Colwellia sp. BRX8-8]